MRTRRLALVLVLFGTTAMAGPAAATPTTTPTAAGSPTPTPGCTPPAAVPACVGSKRLRVSWSANNPSLALVSASGTQCPAPATCTGSTIGLQTTAPVTLTIVDAACRTISATFNGPGVNSGDCPGGKDTYKGSTTGLGDKLRFIYGAATTVLGVMKIPLAQPTPPTLTPPIRIIFRDAAGYAVEETVSTCFTSDLGATARMKCF